MNTTCSDPYALAQAKIRHEGFIQAFNSGYDVDKVMSYFSPKISYSDYTIEALDMNYETTRSYIEKMYKETEGINLIQVRLSGDEHFTAGEWILKFKFKGAADNNVAGTANGTEPEEIEMRGVSLSWYDADGLIVKNCDYGVKWTPGKA